MHLNLNRSVSESVRKLNPDLFPMGAVGGPERKPGPAPALDKNPPAQSGGKAGLVVVVTLVSFRQRLFDDDNSIAGGNKGLRDAIAESLLINDGDRRVRWQYAQVHTAGPQGTLVVMHRL